MPKPAPLATALVATLLATGACQPTVRDTFALPAPAADHELRRIGDVYWYTDFDAAVQVARAAGKPLWVHFGEDPG